MGKETLMKMIELVEQAEGSVHILMRSAEETRGMKGIYKRADTIIGELENLKWLLVDKQK